MVCNIISLEAKVASNDNHYVDVVAQAAGDPFAEELKYRMWCSEALASKLQATPPATIELRKAAIKVEPFQRVGEDGVVNEHVFNSLSVVVRQFKDQDMDDATVLVSKLRKRLLADGLITDVVEDAFDGATGELPE